MTTVKDVHDLVMPLLREDPDIVHHSRFLIVKPIQHHLAAVLLDRTSGPKQFHVAVWPVFPALLGPGTGFATLGTRYFWPYDFYWQIDEAEYPFNRRMQLKYSIIPELKILHPFMRFRNLFNQYFAPHTSGYDEGQALLAIAFGEFSEAAKWMAGHKFHEVRKMINAFSPGLGDRLEAMGKDLPMADKRAAIAMLHEREAGAIRSLKLEKHWQPSPFPAENKGLV